MPNQRYALIALVVTGAALILPMASNGASSRELDDQQVALDERCQIAREKILGVERAQYVEECVNDRSRRTREECERFYADHGNATAARGPLYMELPECVEAHEFRQNRGRR